jgi:hypothetical protein
VWNFALTNQLVDNPMPFDIQEDKEEKKEK